MTLLELGSQTYRAQQLLALLQTSGTGDASMILARQLIAAKLNVAAGVDATPIAATIADADARLAAYPGKLPYRVKPSSPSGQAMTSDATQLDLYNRDKLTPGCAS